VKEESLEDPEEVMGRFDDDIINHATTPLKREAITHGRVLS